MAGFPRHTTGLSRTNQPPQLTETQMGSIFGRVPSTLNPPVISCQQLEDLVRLAKDRGAL
jgi:hypothetical protein